MPSIVYRVGLLSMAAGAVAHLLVGSTTGLSVDEAHYLLYARHLAWSYFDHPPLVGWIQLPWAAFNAPTAIIRLLPQFAWLAMAALLLMLLRAATPPVGTDAGANLSSWGHPAGWLLILFAGSPLFHVIGLGLLPDTLLSLCALGLALWMASLNAQAPITWQEWLSLGLLLGVAGLSKYTALFSALGLLGWLLVSGRQPYRSPMAWLALLLALAMVLPVFIWNAQYDWLSFRYQGGHVAGEGWSPAAFARFLLLQFILVGPVVFLGLWLQLRKGLDGAGHQVLWLWAVPFLVLAWLAGGGRSLPYWTTAAWVVTLPLAALGIAQLRHRGLRTLVVMSLLCQCALIGWTSISLVLGHPAGARPQHTPLADLHGWDSAARALASAGAQRETKTIVVMNWTHASRLAWHAPEMAVKPLDDRYDQFDLWFGALQPGEDALVFIPVGSKRPDNLMSGVLHRVGDQKTAEGRFTACEAIDPSPPHLVLHCKRWQYLTQTEQQRPPGQ